MKTETKEKIRPTLVAAIERSQKCLKDLEDQLDQAKHAGLSGRIRSLIITHLRSIAVARLALEELEKL